MKPLRHCTLLFAVLAAILPVHAQVGEYRNDFSVGVNGGYMLSHVNFTPRVTQAYQGGYTGGLSVRYTCEKYFSTICSLYAELNVAQTGWKEDILNYKDEPVINTYTGEPEKFNRKMTYFQLPLFAHLAWGKERKGLNFFFQAGPQLGYYINDKSTINFEFGKRNIAERANNVVRQDTMTVEHKFDYGITAGAGMEYSHPKLGHFLLEARYYYGLGNMFGDSKRDYFATSNFNVIILKLSYLTDIIRTRKELRVKN